MNRLVLLSSLIIVLGAAGSSHAGPPCLCWPFATEDDDALPFTEAGAAEDVVGKTIEFLAPERSLFAHMEVLRRATMQISGDAAARDALLSRLMQRALDGEASGTPQARAWFDAAFAQAAFHQMGARHLGDGSAWMARAIKLADGNPRMHLAAALIALDGGGDLDVHQSAAERAEAEDALLARNLEIFRKSSGRKRVAVR